MRTSVVSLCLIFAGCTGSNGFNSLVRISAEPAGANCASGGKRIASGIDANADGTLEDSEVESTAYVCDGTTGASGATTLLAISDEPAGAHCPTGGKQIATGIDLDANGVLDAAEVQATSYLCNGATGASGLTTLMAVATEPAGSNCPAGGEKVSSGLDLDADGTLEDAEIQSSRYVCNGTDGQNGLNVLVSTVAAPAGANCASGGQAISFGLDTDRSGVLDPSEVSGTQYVCNGSDGSTGTSGLDALVTTVAVPQGTTCTAGGTQIDSGLDANANGTLDPAEVTSTSIICNGQPARSVLMVCGGSQLDVRKIIPSGTTLSVVDSCAPDAATQALMITRAGSIDTTTLQNYLEAGGIVVTEFSISTNVFNQAFGTNVGMGSENGSCTDELPMVSQFSPGDPFWSGVTYTAMDPANTGCGFDVSALPGITPLAGWSDTAVAVAYRNLGQGRLWLADFDWQDGGASATDPGTVSGLGYMITHRR